MKNEKAVVFTDDNPEWTDEDFARARPASEFHDAAILQLLVRPRGRPAIAEAARKQAVNIRLDREVIDYFKSDGPGWQTRLNDFLAAQVKRASPPTGTSNK
jgi:uncharacterized protein (DUF4415 family)